MHSESEDWINTGRRASSHSLMRLDDKILPSLESLLKLFIRKFDLKCNCQETNDEGDYATVAVLSLLSFAL